MRAFRLVTTPHSLRGKTVLLRVDFNEPIKKGTIKDSFRVRNTAPTIKDFKKRGARIILASHLENTVLGAPVSFSRVSRQIEKMLREKLTVVKQYSRHALERAFVKTPTVLLENLRLHRGEEANSPAFAEKLASLADIYVNEAFSVSHRAHGSIVGVPRFLPSYPGPLFQKEIARLSEALKPPHPFLLIVGGAKFKTKFALLKNFLPKADAIFLGGVLANTFLRTHGISIGESVYEKEATRDIQKHFLKSKKIILPLDVIVSKKSPPRGIFDIETGEKISDVGPETVSWLLELSRDSRYVIWNGPVGFTEGGYEEGTRALLKGLAHLTRPKVILGGGDTLMVLDRLRLHHRFYHVSTGGGAMLDFLADGTLPGIEAIIKSQRSMV